MSYSRIELFSSPRNVAPVIRQKLMRLVKFQNAHATRYNLLVLQGNFHQKGQLNITAFVIEWLNYSWNQDPRLSSKMYTLNPHGIEVQIYTNKIDENDSIVNHFFQNFAIHILSLFGIHAYHNCKARVVLGAF